MAKTSVIDISVTTTGDGLNEAYEKKITNTSSPGTDNAPYAFSNGDNTLVVPAGAQTLLIDGSTQTLKLKGNAGDTGWSLPAGQPVLVPVTAGASVIINSNGASTANLKWR